jgi:endoglucanase
LRRRCIALAAATVALLAAPATAVTLTGVNLAGAEFGGIPGLFGTAYVYPELREMRSFAAMGVNVFRVPVKWERLQRTQGGALEADEMARLDATIATATGMGVVVIIDVHNYARYMRKTLVTDGVPSSALADLWRRLALRYKDNPRVAFGLMNEPVRIGAAEWAKVASEAVVAIRGTGARNLILVPGTAWTGAHSWRKLAGYVSNATAMTGFVDPGNNFAFEFHQYFDANSSGTSPNCVTPEIAERRVAVATDWLRETGNRGFLAEFGVSRQPECQAVLATVLKHLAANREWLGWTVWASSARFGSYPFNLYPFLQPAPPQLDTIKPFLAR